MRHGSLGETSSSPNSMCASFIQKIKMLHALPRKISGDEMYPPLF